MMKKILLDPLPGDGGGAVPSPGSTITEPPTPPPAAPPAATTVLQGTKSERELQLEEENKRLLDEKKKVEVKAAELEDENHRLKTPATPPAPAKPDDDGRWRPFKL
jgi:hypothetical protein